MIELYNGQKDDRQYEAQWAWPMYRNKWRVFEGQLAIST